MSNETKKLERMGWNGYNKMLQKSRMQYQKNNTWSGKSFRFLHFVRKGLVATAFFGRLLRGLLDANLLQLARVGAHVLLLLLLLWQKQNCNTKFRKKMIFKSKQNGLKGHSSQKHTGAFLGVTFLSFFAFFGVSSSTDDAVSMSFVSSTVRIFPEMSRGI